MDVDDELDPGNIANTQPSNPLPFVVALVAFLVVATLAFFFLRENDDFTIVRPERIGVIGPETLRFAVAVPTCGIVERAQVDLSDTQRIFVEVIVDQSGCRGDQTDDQTQLTVTLPQAIDGRQVVPGIGRVELPCDSDGRCAAEQ